VQVRQVPQLFCRCTAPGHARRCHRGPMENITLSDSREH
jgi:hypothetical protein